MIACCAQGSEGSPPPSPEKGCASRAGQPDRPAVEVSPARAGGETVHTSSSRRAGRLIPARAGRYCARTAPSRAPRVALGQVSPHWGRLLACPNDLFPAPMRARVLLPQCAVSYPSAGPRLPRTVGGLVEAPDGPLSRKEEWLGPGLGLFASDVVFSKGSLARWGVARTFPRNPNVSLALGWCGGWFASEAEFSKGYRHFASVITLAKCGTAVKAWYCCENRAAVRDSPADPPTRIAVSL